MWLMTTFGFFSVVQKPGTQGLTVRARVAADLDALRERYLPALSPTTSTPSNDYAYRATVSHADFGAALARISEDITYGNFKSAVASQQGHERATTYGNVWSVLNERLPALDRAPDIPQAKKYGGVVFDDLGRVLLREPRNHFDGYVWTFAKGGLDPGESPAQAALREVREETGVEAEIVGVIPHVFRGGSGSCAYFLMRPLAEHPLSEQGERETQTVVWMAPAEATKLIALTTNTVGRTRDLAVLQAALVARGDASERRR